MTKKATKGLYDPELDDFSAESQHIEKEMKGKHDMLMDGLLAKLESIEAKQDLILDVLRGRK